jgi:hypothetical protein
MYEIRRPNIFTVNRRHIVKDIVDLLLETSPESAAIPTTNGNLALHWAVTSLFRETMSPVTETDIKILQRIYRAYPGALATKNDKGYTVIDIVRGCIDEEYCVRVEDEVELILQCFNYNN